MTTRRHFLGFMASAAAAAQELTHVEPLARRVKLADLEDNMSPDRRIPSDDHRQKRYAAAYARLA